MANETQPPETAGEKAVKKTSIATVLVPVAVILALVLVTMEYLRGRDRAPLMAGHGSAGHAEHIVRKVGEAIPDLDFHALDGSTVKLSELKSKVVVINFWATWCGPCVKEMPSLQRLATEYAERGLTVVGVNLDDEPAKVLTPFLDKHQIKFRSFIDPNGELADRFSVSGLPLTLVVDGNRKLLLEHLGDEEWFAPVYRKQFELWLAGESSG